jgi:hypothetical protein
MSVERAIVPTQSNDEGTNLRMQLEDEHIAKSAIKTQYQEKYEERGKNGKESVSQTLALLQVQIPRSRGLFITL